MRAQEVDGTLPKPSCIGETGQWALAWEQGGLPHTVSPPQPLRHVLVFPGTFPNPGTCPALHAQPAATAAVAAAAVGKMGVLGLQGPPQGGAQVPGCCQRVGGRSMACPSASVLLPLPLLGSPHGQHVHQSVVPRGQGPPLFPRTRGCSLVSQLAVGLPGCLHELSSLMTACWAEEHVGPGWDGRPSDPALFRPWPSVPECVVLGRGGFWGAGWLKPSPVGPFNYTGVPEEDSCRHTF